MKRITFSGSGQANWVTMLACDEMGAGSGTPGTVLGAKGGAVRQ